MGLNWYNVGEKSGRDLIWMSEHNVYTIYYSRLFYNTAEACSFFDWDTAALANAASRSGSSAFSHIPRTSLNSRHFSIKITAYVYSCGQVRKIIPYSMQAYCIRSRSQSYVGS